MNRKGSVFILVLVYLGIITSVVFVLFGRVHSIRNQIADFQKVEMARIGALNSLNLSKTYLNNFSDTVIGLSRFVKASSKIAPIPEDIKNEGDLVVKGLMEKIEKKNPDIAGFFKDSSAVSDPYEWVWIFHFNSINKSDPFNEKINMISLSYFDSPEKKFSPSQLQDVFG